MVGNVIEGEEEFEAADFVGVFEERFDGAVGPFGELIYVHVRIAEAAYC